MISEADCRARADSDWQLAQELASAGKYSWATTVAFYAALHHVNELLVRDGRYRDDMDHPVREHFLSQRHPAIESRYGAMLGKSIRTRYEVRYEADEDYFRYQAAHYRAVREYVDRVIADSVPGAYG